ncbi:tetratricopeptide repeat protein 28-like [Porites lutea]|uniref:tetratricopeptide repeat protein 28-like n=1 Tax=Porites lutea TaxID=51062 RepID=UPI003CC5CA70
MAIGEKELIFWVCQKGKEVELRRKENSSQDEIQTFFQSLVDKIGARDNVECEDRSLELARDKMSAVKRPPRDDRQTQYLHLEKRALCTLYDTIIDPIQDLFSGSELIPVDYHHKSGVLLVGDPWVQDVTKLPTLPFARKEVEMIAKRLGCTPLLGRQATKDEVLRRLGSVALVHIAAHGNIESGEIALAPKRTVRPSEAEFILTMKEVKQIQLRARLVVLSCCHSARGEIKAEGVVGIARAFLGAGARSVLVSLWAIDDKATLEFMKNFYQHLVAGKSASEALNRAMNCIRESTEFSDVTHWAPFVLIGDDVTLEFDGSK